MGLVVVAAGCSSAHRPAAIPRPSILTATTVAGVLDPCAVVTKSDVQAALPGLTIVLGQPSRQPDGGDCLYLESGTSRAIDVKVFRSRAAVRFDQLRTVL